MSHTRMTTLPFLLLVLSPFIRFDSDYPLCKSKTLSNIFMILGGNVKQEQTMCLHTRMTILPFLLLALHVSPIVTCIFDNDYPLISCLLCKSKTLWDIYDTWWKCRAGPDGVMCTRMTTLAFLILELSAFVLFEIDFSSAM